MEINGILHAHSTYSYDGKLSLPELRSECLQRNIRFVCMTEHTDELNQERATAFVEECARYSDAAFLFIPGFEVPYAKDTHVLMIGIREFLGQYAPDVTALRPWAERAAFVVLAHPVRNHFMVDTDLLELMDGLEVWNQQYEGKRVPRTRSLRLLRSLRDTKPLLIATGGVDLHRKEHFGAPLVQMHVDALCEEEILEKLRNGAYIIESKQASFFGTLPDIDEHITAHRMESGLSVSVIVFGKFVNKTLASVGLSLPKGLKQLVRRRL